MNITWIIISGLLGVGALVAFAVLRRKPREPDDAAEAAAPAMKAPPSKEPQSEAEPAATAGPDSESTADIANPDTAYELASEGKVEEAARLAMQRRNWSAATSYYQQLEQHGNAAYCAKRDGKMNIAAQLYEAAGDLDNAAGCWDKHGDAAESRRLRAKIGGSRRAKAQEVIASRGSLPPKQLSTQIEAAIASGDDDRIAQLYAEAGDNDKAVKHWIKAARRSRSPARYLDRIRAISPVQAHNFLEMETKAYPPADKSAELHYQLAQSYITLGAPDGALDILKRLVAAVGEYKDARQLLDDPDTVRARSAEAKQDSAAVG